MAENHKLNYQHIAQDENDELTGLELLQDRLDSQHDVLDNKIRPVSYSQEEKDGRNGINIQLPGNIDFRVEGDSIVFSQFGMTKEELKNVYEFLATMGFTGLSIPEDEDEPFKEVVKDAYRDMANIDGMFESSFAGENSEYVSPQAANDDISPMRPDRASMSGEQILEANRQIAATLRNNVEVKKTSKTAKASHPNVDDISKYIDDHIANTKRDQSRNYRKRSVSHGWEMVWYKDADQKKEGPTQDKKGKVNPNFEFGLRGQIFMENGKPKLSITALTPKYGNIEPWMMDEVMNMAAECGITHLRFNAGMQNKKNFFVACGKKMIVPTGINLKEKDIKDILNAAKENNDKPAEKAAFYRRLAEQIEEQMIKQNINDESHPFVRIVKELRDSAKNDAAVNAANVKYKKFNQFFENNIMGKTYRDNTDENPVPTVNSEGIETDAVKQLATGKAYVEFLALYRDNDDFAKSSDEVKRQKYLELYNKNVFYYDTHLNDLVGKIPDNTPTDRKNKRDLIKDEYTAVNSEIKSLVQGLKNDLGVDIETPDLIMKPYKRYDENGNLVNKNRIAKGRALSAQTNQNQQTQTRTQSFSGRRGRP